MTFYYDYPDDYDVIAQYPYYNRLNLSEVVARLNGFNPLDRNGVLLWFDSVASNTLHFATEIWGEGSAVEISNAYMLSGDNSIKLTVGEDETFYASIYKYLAIPKARAIGFQFYFAPTFDFSQIIASLSYYDGDDQYLGQIIINDAESSIYLLSTGYERRIIANNVNIFPSPLLFNYLKFTCDFENKRYGYLNFNGDEYDLSDYALIAGQSVYYRYLDFNITLWGIDGIPTSVYLDNIAITDEGG
jgi:hypothetical protein